MKLKKISIVGWVLLILIDLLTKTHWVTHKVGGLKRRRNIVIMISLKVFKISYNFIISFNVIIILKNTKYQN